MNAILWNGGIVRGIAVEKLCILFVFNIRESLGATNHHNQCKTNVLSALSHEIFEKVHLSYSKYMIVMPVSTGQSRRIEAVALALPFRNIQLL